jgi:hypothetical protein
MWEKMLIFKFETAPADELAYQPAFAILDGALVEAAAFVLGRPDIFRDGAVPVPAPLSSIAIVYLVGTAPTVPISARSRRVDGVHRRGDGRKAKRPPRAAPAFSDRFAARGKVGGDGLSTALMSGRRCSFAIE